MFCTSCGSAVENAWAFCPQCRRALRSTPSPASTQRLPLRAPHPASQQLVNRHRAEADRVASRPTPYRPVAAGGEEGRAASQDNSLGWGVPAGFWQRVGARLIDGLVLSLLTCGVSYLGVLIIVRVFPATAGVLLGLLLAWLVLALVIPLVYQVTGTGGPGGRTPGRAAVGIRVVRVAPGFWRAGYLRGAGRYLLASLTDTLLLLGSLSLLWNPHKRTWADRMTGTAVVKGRVRGGALRTLVISTTGCAVVLLISGLLLRSYGAEINSSTRDYLGTLDGGVAANGFDSWLGGGASSSGDHSYSGSTDAGGTPTYRPVPTPIPVDPTQALRTQAQSYPNAQAGPLTALSNYFHGINSNDYATAYAILSPSQQARSFESFRAAMLTSNDTDFQVLGVTPSSGSTTVALAFTSLQAPTQGPSGDTCDRWTLDYRMIQDSGGSWRIDNATGHDGSSHSAC